VVGVEAVVGVVAVVPVFTVVDEPLPGAVLGVTVAGTVETGLTAGGVSENLGWLG
jgi:hypothetical protein